MRCQYKSQCGWPSGSRRMTARVDPVDQMKEQCQRGQERTILRQVREQHRMVLLGPQPVLQLGPPPVEEFLGRGIESQRWRRSTPHFPGWSRSRSTAATKSLTLIGLL